MLKVIIWDWDGTLVTSGKLNKAAFDAVFDYYNMPKIGADELRCHYSKALDDMFPDIFGDNWHQAKRIFYDYIERSHLQSIALLDGALDSLDHCKSLGLDMVIVSNKKGNILRQEVNYLNLNSYFKSIKGAGDTEKNKPSSVHANAALANIAINDPYTQIIFIGDTVVDIQCAKNIGCKAILLSNDKDLSKIDQLNIEYKHASDHKHIINIINKINKIKL